CDGCAEDPCRRPSGRCFRASSRAQRSRRVGFSNWRQTTVSERNGRLLMRVFLLAPLLLASCSRAPSFDILGSYFPAWLICLALGVVLTAVIRWLLLRFQIGLVFPIVVYPSLTALFAFGMWLVFYG